MPPLSIKTLVPTALMLCSNFAFAAIVTLGNSNPGFANGTKVGSAVVNTAQSGQPAPFDAFIGSDGSQDLSASWTFNYAPLSNVIGGTITMGIYDSDSAAPGNQVASFGLNSGATNADLTGGLNTLFEASGGVPTGFYNIYTLALPATTIAALASGNVSFSLALQDGLGVLGPSPFNGAALVFSTLDITTQQAPPPQVPLPMAGILFLSGLSALFAAARRKTDTRS